jgi:magnesium-transporting ATPase (P-type)
VYVKGAPEYVIKLCTSIAINNIGEVEQFKEDDDSLKETFLKSIADMASAGDNGQKVLTYAYKDITRKEYDRMLQNANYNIESDEFRENIEFGLTYLVTFGLDDPLRFDIKESI